MFYVAPLLCIALARLGRARRAASAGARGRRGDRLGAPRRRDPVRPLPDDVGDHRHPDAPAAVVAAGPDRRGLDHGRGARHSRSPSPPRSSSCRGATRSPSRSSSSGSGSSRSARSGGARTASSGSRVARCSRESARPTATGSIRRSPLATRGGVPLDGAHRPAHRERERVLQPARRPRLLRRPNPTPGGLPETRVRIDPETGRVTLPDGSPVRDEFLARGLVVRAGRRARSCRTRAGA